MTAAASSAAAPAAGGRHTGALAVVDFSPRTGRIQHVGLRGRGAVEPFDPGRARRLLARHLGADRSAWDDRFEGLDPDRWRLLRIDPGPVVARDQSFVPSLGVDDAA